MFSLSIHPRLFKPDGKRKFWDDEQRNPKFAIQNTLMNSLFWKPSCVSFVLFLLKQPGANLCPLPRASKWVSYHQPYSACIYIYIYIYIYVLLSALRKKNNLVCPHLRCQFKSVLYILFMFKYDICFNDFRLNCRRTAGKITQSILI